MKVRLKHGSSVRDEEMHAFSHMMDKKMHAFSHMMDKKMHAFSHTMDKKMHAFSHMMKEKMHAFSHIMNENWSVAGRGGVVRVAWGDTPYTSLPTTYWYVVDAFNPLITQTCVIVDF